MLSSVISILIVAAAYSDLHEHQSFEVADSVGPCSFYDTHYVHLRCCLQWESIVVVTRREEPCINQLQQTILELGGPRDLSEAYLKYI
jgi:hypothetical protein